MVLHEAPHEAVKGMIQQRNPMIKMSLFMVSPPWLYVLPLLDKGILKKFPGFAKKLEGG